MFSFFRQGLVIILLGLAPWAPGAGTVVINECMASNQSTLADEAGEYDDWIELFNAGDQAVDVGGMFLSDNYYSPTRSMIPTTASAQTTIAPGGFLILWADGTPSAGVLHLDFSLDGDGEEILLIDRDGETLLDRVVFPAQRSDYSQGRLPDGSATWRTFHPATPGSANTGGFLGYVADTTFSVDRGFYTTSFTVAITCETPGATIRYTLDGSEPNPTDNGQTYEGPLPIDSTTCLRAMAFLDGWIPTPVDTQTYLFIADTLRQPAVPAGFPATWGGAPAANDLMAGDYEVDPDVVNNAPYRDRLTSALLSIPSVSLVMDVDEWFSRETGIYSNGSLEGVAWERAVSTELLDPAGLEDFQVNCGVRIQGQTSTEPNWKSPKLSMRLFFRDIYGPSKLRHRLFADSEVDSFDTLVLDARHNQTWIHPTDAYQRIHAQYLRDQVMNDWQNRMGDPSPHGRYVHLYLNGLYWGLYDLHERPDHTFMSDYFGGREEDYDVLRHNANDIIAGTNTAYLTLFTIARGDMTDSAQYGQVAGYLDLKAFANYMLINYYAGNTDWAHKNWYAGYSDENGVGWRYISWDAEHVLKNTTENVTSRNDTFGPTELLHRLKSNDDFKILFADQAQKHLFNGGLLTPEGATAVYNQRAAEVDTAIIMESARWGDHRRDHHPISGTYDLYTRDDHWLTELNRLRTDYFPRRAALVLDQLRTMGLFPSIGAPVLSPHGGRLNPGDTITLTNPNGAGTIWYTLDGSDPRVSGEAAAPIRQVVLVSEDALKYARVPTGDAGDWNSSLSYDTNGWLTGSGGVGYDRDSTYRPWIQIDVRTPMEGVNGSCLIRIPFTTTVEDLQDLDTLRLHIRYDDGFVAYLNGTPVQAVNSGATPAWNATATTTHSDAEAMTLMTFDLSDHLDALQIGDNLLAIHGLNASLTSSDFLISAVLEGIQSADGAAGGGVSPTAIDYTGPITLDHSATLKARVLNGATWSALSEAFYEIPLPPNAVTLSELMYHPPWGEEYEFIELHNPSPTDPVNLSAAAFANGVAYVFPPDATLPPQGYVVIAGAQVDDDFQAFRSFYDLGAETRIFGPYEGRLANDGERVTLTASIDGDPILSFDYGDGRDWPLATDGAGHSLVPLNTDSVIPEALNHGSAWRPSAYLKGSPGQADPDQIVDVVLNEIAAHTDYNAPPYDSNDWIELYNTESTDRTLVDCYLSDDVEHLMKWPVPSLLIEGRDRRVFDEISGFHNPITEGFGIDKAGEQIYLTLISANPNQQHLNRVMDCLRFKGQESGRSLGRYPDGGSYWGALFPTRNLPNTPFVPDLVMDEIMFHPAPTSSHPEDNRFDEYIEIWNPTGATVALTTEGGTWRIDGGVALVFPEGVRLAAGERLLVVNFDPAIAADLTAFKATYGIASPGIQFFGPYTGSLSNSGERVALERPQAPDGPFDPVSWVIVDEVFYSTLSPWPTSASASGQGLQRLSPTQPGAKAPNWRAAKPTPGAAAQSPLPNGWYVY